MARIKAIDLDVSEVTGLSDRLGRLTGEEIDQVTSRALNAVVDEAYELGRDRITVGINLSDDYLKRRMSVEHASSGNPREASITASGANQDMTRLSEYNAVRFLVSRKTTGRARPKNGTMNLPAGKKIGGTLVEVTRGGAKGSENMFLLPRQRGFGANAIAGGNDMGVFVRDRSTKRLKHLMGPSVYQLFGYQINRLEEEALDALEDQLLAEVGDELEKAIRG